MSGWGALALVGALLAGPYTFEPLIQTGGRELVPSVDFQQGLTGWTITGDAKLLRAGQPALRLAPGATAAFEAPAEPLTLYTLNFGVELPAGTTFDYARDYPGLHGFFTTTAGTGRRGPRIHVHSQAGTRTEVTLRLFTGREEHPVLRVDLAAHLTAGAVVLNGFSLQEDMVEAFDQRQVLHTADTDWAETPRSPARALPRETSVFARPLDRLAFWSRPFPAELETPLTLAGTPGETVVAAVAVTAKQTLRHLRPVPAELAGPAGKLPADAQVWRWVEYRRRRVSDLGAERTFHWVADAFRDRPEGVETRAGRTEVFWLRLTIPPDARPGEYHGPLAVTADGWSGELPVELTVHNFHLAEPDAAVWALYADGALDGPSAAANAADLKAHGVDSLVVGVPGEVVWDGEQVTGYRLAQSVSERQELAKAAGLRGPWLLWLEPLERQLAAKLARGPAFDTAFGAALASLKAEWLRRGWGTPAYLGLDEPGYWKPGSPATFAWQYGRATAAGWETYGTSSYPVSDPLGQLLTYHAFGRLALWSPRWFDLAKAARAAGQHPWSYSTGCYSGQVGVLGANRAGAGLRCYRSGADGCVSWTFCRPRGDAYDDFAGDAGQYCLTLPDPDHPGAFLDTPQWEGLRQGWLDYRYALTLARRLAAAAKEPKRKTGAAQIAGSWELMWNEQPWPLSDFDDDDCTRFRTKMAEWIERLGP